MITSIQKIIGIGSSDGVTIPTKELRRENLKRGDEVEVIVRPVQKRTNAPDEAIIHTAKKILDKYRSDFRALAKR